MLGIVYSAFIFLLYVSLILNDAAELKGGMEVLSGKKQTGDTHTHNTVGEKTRTRRLSKNSNQIKNFSTNGHMMEV